MSPSHTLFRWLAGAGLAVLIAACSATGAAAPPALWGSSWRLEQLDGAAALPGATLVFPDTGRVSGNASCNRFFGTAQIDVDRLKLGALGSTRMACAGALMAQEARYLALLQKAVRYEMDGGRLLIHTVGEAQPLRLVR